MSLPPQEAIRRNTESIKDMLSDVSKWEDEMRLEDEKLSNLRVKETSQIDIQKKDAGSKSDKALLFKEEGNKLYSQGKWIEAVRKYAEAILLDSSNAIYPANRAMANIKLENYIAAEADCTLSLSLDPTYVKALLRRATARNKQKKFSLAAEDYRKVLSIESWNKEAIKELEILNKKLDNSIKLSKLIPKPYESIPGRHQISFLDSPLDSSTQKYYKKLPIRDVSSMKSIPSVIVK